MTNLLHKKLILGSKKKIYSINNYTEMVFDDQISDTTDTVTAVELLFGEKLDTSNNNNDIINTPSRTLIPLLYSKKYKIISRVSPKNLDYRPKFGKITDQGKTGSCVPHSVCSLMQFFAPKFTPSPLFNYYVIRDIYKQGLNPRLGTTIRDCVIVLKYVGVCKESEWPNIINNATIKPPDRCYKSALKNTIKGFGIIQNNNLENIKSQLLKGIPLVFGLKIYDSFFNSRFNGIVPMPDLNKDKYYGNHALVIVGYKDSTKQFIVRNSWGVNFGIKGYIFLPYEYVLDNRLSYNLWYITGVTILN